MKKLLALILILIIAAFGGYTFYWNKRADEVKTTITDSITQFNGWAKVYTGNDQTIKYESAKTSGWPFHVNVTLVHPVVTVPVHNIAKMIAEAEKKNTPPATPALPDEVEKALPEDEKETAPKTPAVKDKLNVAGDTTWIETYEGEAAVISTDLFATTISIAHEGEQKATSTFNGVETNNLSYKASVPYTCTLEVTRDEANRELFDIKSIFKDGDNFVKRFREFACSARGINSTDTKTKEVYATTEYAAMSYGMDLSNKAQGTGHLVFNITNQKASKAFDKVMSNYVSMFYKLFLSKEADLSILGIPMSELGNNNIAVDITFAGPTAPELYLAKDMSLNVSINKFNVQNDLMKFDFETHLKSNQASNPEQRDSSFVLRTNANYSQRFDELKLQEIQKVVENVLKEPSEKEMEAFREDVLKKLKIEEVRQAVAELWPNFHKLGNITLAIDVAAKTANPPMSPNGEITVNNLDYVTSLNGIKISGKADAKGMMPTGEMKVTCLACENLIDSVYAYIKVVDKWAAKVDETYVAPVTDDMVTALKAFLKDISVPAKDATGKEVAADWFYYFKMPEGAAPTVNDKGMDKVMESYGKHLGSVAIPGQSAPQEGEEGKEDAAPESKFEPEGAEEKPTN